MKILLYGEYWDGTHIDCISKVLFEKGVDFKIFNFCKFFTQNTGFKLTDKVCRKLLYSKSEVLTNKALLKEIDLFKPTVLLISKGLNIFPETLQAFKNSGITILNWNPDDFFNPKNSSKHLLGSLDIYDVVFSARRHLFEEYKIAGIRNTQYLEWYFIPWLHTRPLVEYPIKKKISFVGTHSSRREAIIQSIPSNYPIEIWGSGWNFSSLRLKKHISIHGAILTQRDFPTVMSQSLVNLNILTSENRDQTNLKIFEITASYGLLLSEFNGTCNSILRAESECYYYDPVKLDSLKVKIEQIFQGTSIEVIKDVRNAGFKKIQDGQHSISQRVGQILNVLKQEFSN